MRPPPRRTAQDREFLEAVEKAPVFFDGLPIFELRGSLAVPAQQRARAVSERLIAAARDPAFDPAAIELRQVDDRIELRGSTGFLLGVYDSDANLEGMRPEVLAEEIKARIVSAVGDYRAARSAAGVRRALGIAAVETMVFAGAVAALFWVARRVLRRLDSHVEVRIARWEERAWSVVQLRYLWQVVRRILRGALVIFGLVVLYTYLNALLLALPWTRDVGRQALANVVAPLRRLGLDILHAVPNLIALAVIIAVTVSILRVVARFFALVGAGSISLGSFEPEWAVPTERLVRLGVIVLAVIMAYPYIPGSSSEAFKAISIFAGILFSLGSGSWVANLIAGYSMIYRRAFRVGDRVEIAGITGTVEELSLQDTHIRTLMNERVTLPNALVLFEPRRQPHAARAEPWPDPPHGGAHRLRRSVAAGGSAAAGSGAPHPWDRRRAGALRAPAEARRVRAGIRGLCRDQRRDIHGAASTRRCTPTFRTSSPSKVSKS